MLAFIGAHSLPLAAIALAGYLVLGAIMPIASSKLCGNAGRASRDAAGSISAYVLDGLRGLAETVQFAGVSKRSVGLAAQTDARLHGPFPARALRCGRGPGGCVGAAHQPRHDRDVAGAFRRGRPLVLVRVHLLLCVPVLLWPGAGGVPSGHVAAGNARLRRARARSFGRGAPDRGRGRWCGCFLWRRGVRTRDVLLRRSRRQ